MYCISVTGFHIEEDFGKKKHKNELFCAHWEKQYTKAHQTYSIQSYINQILFYLLSDSSSHLLPTEYSELLMLYENLYTGYLILEKEKYWVSTVKHDVQHKYHQVRKMQSGVRKWR